MAFPGVEEFNMEFKVFKGALVNNNAPTASSTPLHLHLQVLRLGTHPQPQAKTRCQVRNTPPQPQAKVKRPNEVLRLGTHSPATTSPNNLCSTQRVSSTSVDKTI